MDDIQLRKKLNAYGLTLAAACKEICILTEGQGLISPDDLRKHMDRHGCMSKSNAAQFHLFFEFKKLMKARRHEQAA